MTIQSLSNDIPRDLPEVDAPVSFSKDVAGPYHSVDAPKSIDSTENQNLQENRYENPPPPPRAPAPAPPPIEVTPIAVAPVAAAPFAAYQPRKEETRLATVLPPAKPKLGDPNLSRQQTLALQVERLQIENGKIKFQTNQPNIRDVYRDPDTRAAFLDISEKNFAQENATYLDAAYALEAYPRAQDPVGYLAKLNDINTEYILQDSPNQINVGAPDRVQFNKELKDLNEDPTKLTAVDFKCPTIDFVDKIERLVEKNSLWHDLVKPEKNNILNKIDLKSTQDINDYLKVNQNAIDHHETQIKVINGEIDTEIQKDSSSIVDLDAQIDKQTLIEIENMMGSSLEFELEAAAREKLIGNHIPDLDEITKDPVANDLFIKHLALNHPGIDNSFLVPPTEFNSNRPYVPPKTPSEIARKDMVLRTFTQSADFKKYRSTLPKLKNVDQGKIKANNALIKLKTVKSPKIDALKAERSQLAAKNKLAKEIKATEARAEKASAGPSGIKGFFGRLFSRNK